MLNKDNLPPCLIRIIEDYLLKSVPDITFDHALLVALNGVSKILCNNRVRMVSKGIKANNAPPNIYALAFAPSGAGKDRVASEMDEAMVLVENKLREEFEYIYGDIKRNVEKDADKKIKEGELIGGEKARKEYISLELPLPPYELSRVLGSGSTVQGFLQARAALAAYDIGSIAWEDSEIFDTMKTLDNKTLGPIISAVKETYDKGNEKADRVIKTERSHVAVKGVPTTMMVHGPTSISPGLFKEFFDLGYARRSIVYMYDRDEDFTEADVDQRIKWAEEADDIKEEIQLMLLRVYNKTAKNNIKSDHGPEPYKQIVFTDEVVRMYHENEIRGKAYTKSIIGSQLKGVGLERSGRAWKALKIAAVLCALSSDDKLEVNGVLYEAALGICAHYAEMFRKFYCLQEDSLEQQIVEYIKDSGGVKKSHLNYQQWVHRDSKRRKEILNSLIEGGGLNEYLYPFNEYVEIRIEGRATVYYISKIPDHAEITQSELPIVNISVADHNSNYEKSGYRRIELDFAALHYDICKERKWSTINFKDGKAYHQNRIPGENLLVIDIDNAVEDTNYCLTIKQAHERFKQYVHLIVPTKSHQKGKPGESPRDKFRILFPLSTPIDIGTEEKAVAIEKCIKYLGLTYPNGVADIAASKKSDASWIGAMGKPLYNLEGKLFNWKVADYKISFEKLKEKPKNNKANSIDPSTMVSIKGKDYSLPECHALVSGSPRQKMPCNCPMPGHEDKNASAFATINEDGNLQFSCSAGCETKYFDIN